MEIPSKKASANAAASEAAEASAGAAAAAAAAVAAAAAAAAARPRHRSQYVVLVCVCVWERVWEEVDSEEALVVDQALEEKEVPHPPNRLLLRKRVSLVK